MVLLHLSAKENRRVMKAFRMLADAAAVIWNMGALVESEGREDLNQYPGDDRSKVLKKLKGIDSMVTEMHAKAGLAPQKLKRKMEREVEERRKKEREGLMKRQAKTWAQKIAKQPPPPTAVIDKADEAAEAFTEANPPKGPKAKASLLVLCIIRAAPSIAPTEFTKRRLGAIKWFEKEIKRCYGGRDIKVVNIKQEKDGERKIELELPEGLPRAQAREEIPRAVKRIFGDIKEVFWDVPSWKLVVHGVPFEERETQAALRTKLEAENGPLRISKRNIQRLINREVDPDFSGVRR
ncbi:hypothetical protein BGX38DRAFT_828173 [Terfezia claveryi]|nr:hypothetical protein BGX38DRAFT_828173 [Terfezia claveryi]